MADWKDFCEDNKERFGQYLDALEPRTRRPSGADLQPAPVILFCPVCHSAYTSDQDLSQHLFIAHAGQHVYLRVNGAIVRDLAWTNEGIRELSLVLLGHDSASVRITASSSEANLTAKNEVSLTKHVPATMEGELRIMVKPEAGTVREFTIYCGSLPEFRCDDLDAVIVGLQDDYTRSPRLPNISEWRKAAGKVGHLGDLENRYLNGFYEYILAFGLEEDRKSAEAKGHFEEAFGRLLPFRTALAHSAQCVLGLRMNCFGVLQRSPDSSSVAAAGHFFNEPYPSQWSVPEGSKAGNPFVTYADNFMVRLVNVVVAYYAADETALWQGISALEFHSAALEKNHADKLALLKARASRNAGDTAGARKMYDLIRYHPRFGNEAEAYLNGSN